MGKILHMMIGGIGTGKSSFAKKISKKDKINIVSADDIQDNNPNIMDDEVDMLTLQKLEDCLNDENSFIIDGKCLTSHERKRIISDAQNKGFSVYGYDFGSGSIMSFFRRLFSPRRYTKKEWEEVYESDKRLYQTPELVEGFDKIYIQPK
jgi:hypothetical protein